VCAKHTLRDMLTLGRSKAQFVSRAMGTYPLCGLAAFLVRHPEGLAIVRAGPAHSRRPEEMPSCGSAPTPATSTPAIADEYAGLTCVCSSGWRHVSIMRRGRPASVGSPRKTLSSVVKHSTSASGESGSGTGLPGMRKRADLLGGLPSADPDRYGSGRMVVRTLPAGLPVAARAGD
jgi:hypothetical protein